MNRIAKCFELEQDGDDAPGRIRSLSRTIQQQEGEQRRIQHRVEHIFAPAWIKQSRRDQLLRRARVIAKCNAERTQWHQIALAY